MHAFTRRIREPKLLLALIICLWSDPCSAQGGILQSIDGDVEDCLLNYVVKRQDLPRPFAYVGKGRAVSTRRKLDKLHEVELWQAEATSADNKGDCFSIAYRQQTDAGFSKPAMWEQYLRVDGRRYYRRGATGTLRDFEASEKEDTPAEESVTRKAIPVVDPYFFPFFDSAAFLTARPGPATAERFISKFELRGSYRDQDMLVGVWGFTHPTLADWRVTISFDPKQNNLPRRVVWELGKAKHISKDAESSAGVVPDPKAPYTLVCDCSADWQKLDFGATVANAEAIWAPKAVSRLDVFDADEFTETEFTFIYKELGSQALPKPEDGDWRQPIASMFDLDWNESYSAFSQRNKR